MSNRYYLGLFLAAVPWTALILPFNTWLGVSLLSIQIFGLFLMRRFSKDKA